MRKNLKLIDISPSNYFVCLLIDKQENVYLTKLSSSDYQLWFMTMVNGSCFLANIVTVQYLKYNFISRMVCNISEFLGNGKPVVYEQSDLFLKHAGLLADDDTFITEFHLTPKRIPIANSTITMSDII